MNTKLLISYIALSSFTSNKASNDGIINLPTDNDIKLLNKSKNSNGSHSNSINEENVERTFYWPNGVIPIVISPNIVEIGWSHGSNSNGAAESFMKPFTEAISELEQHTCIRFKPKM